MVHVAAHGGKEVDQPLGMVGTRPVLHHMAVLRRPQRQGRLRWLWRLAECLRSSPEGAALEQGDVVTLIAKLGSGDGSTKAGTDNHYVKDFLNHGVTLTWLLRSLVTEGRKLPEFLDSNAGFFPKFPPSRRFKTLVHIHEAARQGPLAFKRMVLPLN